MRNYPAQFIKIMAVKLRQRLWAFTVLVAFSLAVLLWTTEHATTDFSIKPKRDWDKRDDDLKGIDDTHDLQSAYADKEEKIKAQLSKIGYEIIANKSYPFGNSNSSRRPVPPFRWCYDNETSDAMIMDELPCGTLFEGGDNDTYKQAKERAKHWTSPCEYTDRRVAELATKDCSTFLSSFNFLDDSYGVPVSEEELSFPLAYVMVMEKWSSQVVRILSSVYRRHNIYCLTYDKHASTTFKEAIRATARCLNTNVFMPDDHYEIYWADISLLNATLQCMRMIADTKHEWKYVQILSYNDFPLRTNKEMVQILRQFNGANDVELTKAQTERFAHFYRFAELEFEKSKKARPIPPAGLVIYKGSFAATLSREFIRFVFDDDNARRFLEWSIPTWAPEEQFWSTLIHNEHLNAPGHFPGQCLEYYQYGDLQKSWISRYQVWYTGCEGRIKSGSCIFGVGDLPGLFRRPELIAHKFYQDYQPAAFYCMAKRHYERTFMAEDDWEFEKVHLDKGYYLSLPAVQYQRMKDKRDFNCAIMFKRIVSPI